MGAENQPSLPHKQKTINTTTQNAPNPRLFWHCAQWHMLPGESEFIKWTGRPTLAGAT
jgi:hypothetical protein